MESIQHPLPLILLPASTSLPGFYCWKDKLILAPLFKTWKEAVVDKELIILSNVNARKSVEGKRDDGLFWMASSSGGRTEYGKAAVNCYCPQIVLPSNFLYSSAEVGALLTIKQCLGYALNCEYCWWLLKSNFIAERNIAICDQQSLSSSGNKTCPLRAEFWRGQHLQSSQSKSYGALWDLNLKESSKSFQSLYPS